MSTPKEASATVEESLFEVPDKEAQPDKFPSHKAKYGIRKFEVDVNVDDGTIDRINFNVPGNDEFYHLVGDMIKIHATKNLDYGAGDPMGNFMTSVDFDVEPWRGALIRMTDKWSRLKSLVRNKRAFVKNESMEDTLLDMAVYSLLTITLLRRVGQGGERK